MTAKKKQKPVIENIKGYHDDAVLVEKINQILDVLRDVGLIEKENE